MPQKLSRCVSAEVIVQRVMIASTIFVLSALSIAALTPVPAAADVVWRNGSPVFTNDRRRERYQPRRDAYSYGYQSYDRDGNRYDDRDQDRYRERRAYRQYPKLLTGGPRPPISPEAPDVMSLSKSEPAGTIIIDTAGRQLFYTLGGNQAYVYPISVGRDGFRWTGNHKVSRIQSWPSWHPPAEMRKRQPGLPIKMEGGVRNPLGAKALYLGSTLYRIHGTNDAKTIGRAASSGCFRMMNKHVLHLATLAKVGTNVRVVKRYDGAGRQAVSQLSDRRR